MIRPRVASSTLEMIHRQHGRMLDQLMWLFGAETGVSLTIAIALKHKMTMPPLDKLRLEPEFRGKPQRGEYA